jgi:hypothetical protein
MLRESRQSSNSHGKDCLSKDSKSFNNGVNMGMVNSHMTKIINTGVIIFMA